MNYFLNVSVMTIKKTFVLYRNKKLLTVHGIDENEEMKSNDGEMHVMRFHPEEITQDES